MAPWSPINLLKSGSLPTPFFLLTPTHSLALLWIDVALGEPGLLLTQHPLPPSVGWPTLTALPNLTLRSELPEQHQGFCFLLCFILSLTLFSFSLGSFTFSNPIHFCPLLSPWEIFPFIIFYFGIKPIFPLKYLRWGGHLLLSLILPTHHQLSSSGFFTYLFIYFYWNTVDLWGFPGGSDGKESASNAGDLGSIPGLGSSPGGGYGNPLQYSCLENSHGHGGAWWATVHGVAKGWTQLSD